MRDLNLKKTLSVVVPCYNCGGTLYRALKSIENQSRQPDEIIVVDDCSKDADGIRSVVSLFNNTRLIRNHQNIGLAGSRNVGIWATRCEIVAFLDADDECHPDRFQEQMKYVSPRRVVTCDAINPAEKRLKSEIHDGGIKTYAFPLVNMFFPSLTGAAMMAEVAVLKRIGGYDNRLRACEDYELWLRLLGAGIGVIRIKKPLYLYHDSPGSLSKNTRLITESMLFSVHKFINKDTQGGIIWHNLIWFGIWSKILINLEVLGVRDMGLDKLLDKYAQAHSPTVRRVVMTLARKQVYRRLGRGIEVLKRNGH